MNILLVTLDQFRGDCFGSAGHASPAPRTSTGSLPAACASTTTTARPLLAHRGEPVLYTGTYQMNNRVVANGTPLDDKFDNLARAARRAGLRPDAVRLHRPRRRPPHRRISRTTLAFPAMKGYFPASRSAVDLARDHAPWIEWLRDLGYDVASRAEGALSTEPDRPAERRASRPS